MRRLKRFGLASALALILAGVAPAQFPGGRPGGYGFNPYAAQNYSFGYNYSFGFNYVNPITGSRTVYQTYQSYNSPSPYGNIPIPGLTLAGAGLYLPGGGFSPGVGARNPYLGNGFGGAAFAQPNALAVQQAAQVRAQAGAPKGGPANNPPAGIAPKPDARPAEAAKPKPAELVALPEPTPDSINKLLADIAKLDGEGAKADAPLLPPELLGSLQYAPPAAQAALALLQQPDPLEVPQQLEGPARLTARKALLAAAKPVLELVKAGKQPAKDAVATLREATGAARKELAADAEQPDAFFARLDALADAASNPDLAGINDSRLQSTGMTALEFSRYAKKYSLKVADAPAGSEAAYRSLTRALAGYRQELAGK